METVNERKQYRFLDGGGELGALTRNYDWSRTPVGRIESWPQSLKLTVGTILHSGFPMFLWWGEEMTQFYNDAYRPSLGENGKHPKALGQNGKECWPEIWQTINPLITKVKTTGESFFLEDQLIPIYRNGRLEDVYWTFSYSAVYTEEGDIGGVLVVCHETTRKVQTFLQLKTTQEKLKLSEMNLYNIIHQAPVAMCIFKGSEFILEIANDRMLTLFGRPRERMIGKPIFDELVDARDEGFEGFLKNVLATGETFSAYGAPVTVYRNDETEVIYVNFVYEAFREGDGAISGVMAVAVEVTKEFVARKKLEESENKIRSLVESAPFPIGVYEGREMRITMLNQAIVDVWGKGTDLIGKRYRDVLPELENQDIYPLLDKVFTTGVPYHGRNQRVDLHIEGAMRTFYFNYSFTPLFDADGTVYGVMNTAADVTDLNIAKQKIEQSEQNFRNMVKQAPVAMAILMGPDHVVEVANDLIVELWGKPLESVIHRPIFDGLPDARNQGLEALMHNVYATGHAFVANERPVVLLRNGKHETVYQNFVYEPYRDSSGTILGILAITIDVTDQVTARLKIEDIVKERTESLRKTNSELSQFAYIASHDLQEPARKIRTFVEMLDKALGPDIPPKAKTFLSKIEHASTRMLRLIRDVLTISQLSFYEQEMKAVDLNGVLEDVMNDYELLIEQKGCSIQSDALPVIKAIPIQMSQLFTNLISNSIKFSKKDEPLILHIRHTFPDATEIASVPVNPGQQYIKIEFSDNGIGFNQENAVQIFDIFNRLHGKSEYQGTGIGLAMCRKIVENHGGHIFATSALGKGATFTVILPREEN